MDYAKLLTVRYWNRQEFLTPHLNGDILYIQPLGETNFEIANIGKFRPQNHQKISFKFLGAQSLVAMQDGCYLITSLEVRYKFVQKLSSLVS